MEQTTLERPESPTVLRGVKALFGDTVSGVDGDISHVKDLLFDDERWVIRYFVVGTGHWLEGRRVLISPMALRQPEWGWPRLWVTLTRDEIAESPAYNPERPVTRREEMEYHRRHGWLLYWGSVNLWGPWATPAELVASPEEIPAASGTPAPPEETDSPDDAGATDEAGTRMCSARNAFGYHIHATDGDIGHVEDLIVDGCSWQVRYMVVGTTNWWFGTRVLVPLNAIRSVDRAERTVRVDLTREDIRQAPEWDLTQPIRPGYEQALSAHYTRLGCLG